MGKQEKEVELVEFADLDADDLRALLIAERRDTARLKKALVEVLEDKQRLRTQAMKHRVFEWYICDSMKLLVNVVMVEDVAFPAPLEKEKWEASRATDEDVFRAIDGLSRVRSLRQVERVLVDNSKPVEVKKP